MTTLDKPAVSTASFWQAAGATAVAALLFPRLNAVMYDHEKIWQLDSEARVLAPLVIVVALAIFAAVGRLLWRSPRSATASLVIGIVAVIGILAYWLSVPIILGGLAATIGAESLRRGDTGRGRALTGVVLGALTIVSGAALWLINA
jgi:hypothetical protein